MSAEDSLKDTELKWSQMITHGTPRSHCGLEEAAGWASGEESCKRSSPDCIWRTARLGSACSAPLDGNKALARSSQQVESEVRPYLFKLILVNGSLFV